MFLPKRILYLIGLALLILAFIAAAAGGVVYSVPGVDSAFLSAHDTWKELRPNGFLETQFLVKKHLGHWVWDPVLLTILRAPAWLIFALPGGLLTWFFRHPSIHDEEFNEEDLYLYDQLAAAAKEEGFEDDLPSGISHIAHMEHAHEGDPTPEAEAAGDIVLETPKETGEWDPTTAEEDPEEEEPPPKRS